jgi:hypothetical protein
VLLSVAERREANPARLVQYYFGTPDELFLATQRHVAARSVARVQRAFA